MSNSIYSLWYPLYTQHIHGAAGELAALHLLSNIMPWGSEILQHGIDFLWVARFNSPLTWLGIHRLIQPLKSSIYECPIASAATPFEEEEDDILILQVSPRLQQAERRPALWVIRLTWHQLMEELANDKTDPFHFEIMLWYVSRPKMWQNQKATMTVKTLAAKLHQMVTLFLRFRKRFIFSTFVCTRLAGWNCLG